MSNEFTCQEFDMFPVVKLWRALGGASIIVLAGLSSLSTAVPSLTGSAVVASELFPTTDGQFSGLGILSPGRIVELTVAGRAGVPHDAAAVALNLIATNSPGDGIVTVYPCGSARPLASNLNYSGRATVANSVLTQVGVGGKVCIFTSNFVNVIADITGWFPAGGDFSFAGPARLMDTRIDGPTVDGLASGLGRRTAGSVTELSLAGREPVPTDASIVTLNLTVTDAQAPGFVTVYPCGSDRPTASNLNYLAHRTIANVVVTKLSPSGTICMFTSAPVDLIVDLSGFARVTDEPGSFAALVPSRLIDSRVAATSSTIDGQFLGGGTIVEQSVVELGVAGRGGVVADASSVVLNITVADAGGAGFITVYPCGSARPTASSLNYSPGSTVANSVIAKIGHAGAVCLFTSKQTDLVVDVSGYFPAMSSYVALSPARILDTRRPIGYLPAGEHGCTANTPITEPDLSAIEIGTSREGRPILAEFYGDPAGRPVLIVGPSHGDECSPLMIVEHLRALGREGAVSANVRLVIIPTLNPDGLANGTRRNARYVDLNRDGTTLSEPESQALMAFTESLQPVVSIHLHSPLRTSSGQGGPYELGNRMAEIVAARTGLSLLSHAGYNAYYLWSGQARVAPGMATLLIELPRMGGDDAPYASGGLRPGPDGGSDLWDVTTAAIFEAIELIDR